MKSKNRQNTGHRYQIVVLLFVAFCATSMTKVSAQGDLMIFPKRLVLDDINKVQDINLANIGKDTAMYDVSFIQYRMNAFGGFELITEPDSNQHFATPFLRLFPRRVILAPNESQLVKIQLVRTNELETGEYRSHLYFRQVLNKKPLGNKDIAVTDKPTGVSVSLISVYGISIPCIIRKGESNTTVSISELEYENIGDSLSFIKMNLHRTGNMSTYGDISVSYIDSNNKSFEVGITQGVSIYTPGQVRKCKMELKKMKGIDYSKGKIKVSYLTQESKKVLAEAELVINH